MTELAWETILQSIESNIACGKAFPIAAEVRLYLLCDMGPNRQKFALLFREVWQTMPEVARLAIVDFWKRHAQFGRPLIEYSNMWLPCDDRIRATTVAFRGEMKFLARKLDPMPDGAVRFIIAHELAHVFQKARGDLLGPCRPDQAVYVAADGVKRTIDENEDDADDLAESWGFPKLPLLLWDLKDRSASNSEEA